MRGAEKSCGKRKAPHDALCSKKSRRDSPEGSSVPRFVPEDVVAEYAACGAERQTKGTPLSVQGFRPRTGERLGQMAPEGELEPLADEGRLKRMMCDGWLLSAMIFGGKR